MMDKKQLIEAMSRLCGVTHSGQYGITHLPVSLKLSVHCIERIKPAPFITNELFI